MKAHRISAFARQHESLLAARARVTATLAARQTCCYQAQSRRGFSAAAAKDLLWVSEEVKEAVATNKPVVALESTIYTHGFMGKGLAQEHIELVRKNGGIPAIIALLDGVPSVGVSSEDIIRMIENEGTVKASRRDISYIAGMGLAGRPIHGGTTISGTMLLAKLAGIRVFGTGGLGGVHRGGENTMDVSADLTELGRTRVAVIASGCKGFLDLPRTLEFLETQGCLVSTFADGRAGSVEFPAFWARESGVKSPSTVYTEKEAAAMILAQEQLGIESGMLFANPVPESAGIPKEEMKAAIETAVREADEKGFTGSKNTPYVLGRLRELTGDKAMIANMALVESNIIRATNVAVELSRLQSSGSSSSNILKTNPVTVSQTTASKSVPAASTIEPRADILVAGSVAVDLSCDYVGFRSGDKSPQPHTSNPAQISQSIGGVGHNVALAAHRASGKSKVRFCSMVGDDVAGSTVLTSLGQAGLDTARVRKLDATEFPGSRTAQYVAVNDGHRDLVMAMADMNLFTKHPMPEYWNDAVGAAKPKWMVVDGNWNAEQIRTWIQAGQKNGAKIAFEPVSAEKSKGLFCPERGLPKLRLFPEPSIDLASPNTYELAAMYGAAKENGYLDSMEWFEIIDSFGMRGAREKFVYMTSAALTDAGVPVQSVQLLPYIPRLLTKLGSDGVLLTELLAKDDPRLRDRDEEEYILARTSATHPTIGGIYMRLFPPVEKVHDVVSVNGVGDTFLGVLIAGLAQGGRVDKLINVAQKGAVLSLRCAESVSPEVSSLEADIQRAAAL